MAEAVISTGRRRVLPAIRAASTGEQPVASRCSLAKVTSRIEFALATPTDMIAPNRAGMEKAVPVRNRLITMPQKASGSAAMTTKGSTQV